jgi:hypothetical protein
MLFVGMVQSRFSTDPLGSGIDFIGTHRRGKWMTFWMTFSLKIAVFLSSTLPRTLMNPMRQGTPSALGAGGRRFKSSRPDQTYQPLKNSQWKPSETPPLALRSRSLSVTASNLSRRLPCRNRRPHRGGLELERKAEFVAKKREWWMSSMTPRGRCPEGFQRWCSGPTHPRIVFKSGWGLEA